MDKLLEEMKNMRKEFIDDMYSGQRSLYNDRFINKRCMLCKRHRIIDFEKRIFHICNDTYSGDWYAGEHIFYSETADMCLLGNGFINKNSIL